MPTTPARLADLLQRSAATHPDRPAVESAAGTDRRTYATLWRNVGQGAAVLAQMNLPPGARVLFPVAAGPDWIASFLALTHADLVPVALPADTPPALASLAARFTGAVAWIDDGTSAARGRELAHLPAIAMTDLARTGDMAAVASRPVRAGATAVILFTSGSTDRPRAVALSHEALHANVAAVTAVRQPLPDETLLSVLPPAHAYELVAGQLAPLAAGARIVYGGPALPNRLLRTVAERRVTRLVLVPSLLEALVRELLHDLVEAGVVRPECHSLQASELAEAANQLTDDARARIRTAVRDGIGADLRTVVVGGAALDPAWTAVLDAAGVQLDVGYGLTEAGCVVSIGDARHCPSGSAGHPLPGIRVRIGDDEEVLIRTPSAMTAYVGDAPGTDTAFEAGWLHTGDRGRIDDEGYLFVTGRIKDAMVTAGGETIYPEEVEACYHDPAFAELAVVPGHGPNGNDRPMLVVVPAGTSVTPELAHRTAGRLRAAAPARLRVADVVYRTAPLPRTALGKIRRRAVAAELEPSKEAS